MNTLSAHLWVYWRSLKYVFLILLTIMIINSSLQFILYYITGNGFESIQLVTLLSPLWGMMIGSLIALPLVQIYSIPFLLSFNSRRKDIWFSSVVLNTVLAAVIAIIVLQLLLLSISESTNALPDFYMGIILADLQLVDKLLILLLSFCLFFAVISAVYFLCTIFFRFGIIYGLSSSIAFVAIVLLLFVERLYVFFVWGGSHIGLSLILLAIGVAFINASKIVLAKVDSKMPSPKARDAIYLILAIIILAASFHYTAIAPTNQKTMQDRGTFSYWDEGIVGRSFEASENQNLYLSWRSAAETGSITLRIESYPTAEVIYELKNESIITQIPLSAGTYNLIIDIDNVTNGQYRYNSMIK
ncbi:hypothetical protein [Desulfuribacillus alkaliarsenatis]|uniref:Uncharacterized protein n=1 Tax=Desulfuribacillus alkaliarsenatis TaxID=766136 RepID=A0A1E5G355_9FIRM|nr:hypothetical protein [Desulfuribacillus alkaliarsenatis]OEF97506.1 hypothetical protein BHF68_04685 [Desulfuribacillus alkaliarsenatis]